MTKKRGRESMLLDSEKLKHTMHGIESLKKESLKKSKVSVVSKTYICGLCLPVSKLDPFAWLVF